ncbi:tetratricopeptide repeat protein [Streptomyces sp. JB150]|nr:tetratricopeptide repeat protein [Streptomyces sp. JB150]
MGSSGRASYGTVSEVDTAAGPPVLKSAAPHIRPCEADQVNQDWENRVAATWATFDDYAQDRAADFRALIDALVAELPEGSPDAPFEQACAWDSTGRSDRAVPLYREALARGLTGYKARRAKIQLASSLRNTGHPEEGVELLTPELDAPSDELDDAVRATLALCLSSLGRDREGLSLALGALAAHLPRYQRSMANYARALTEPAG